MSKKKTIGDNADFDVHCRHPDFLGAKVSYVEFAVGALDRKSAKDNCRLKWGGGFRGRPRLIRQIMDALRLTASRGKPNQMTQYVSSLRAFWRFLDKCEQSGFSPVETLKDLTTAHGVHWIRSENPHSTAYGLVRSVFDLARQQENMEPLAWMAVRSNRYLEAKDVPSAEQAHRIYLELKKLVYAVYERWRAAEHLASQGRNLLNIEMRDRSPKTVTAADIHATYRALIRESGNPAPSNIEFMKALGYGSEGHVRARLAVTDVFPHAGVGMRDIIKGLYPAKKDLQDFFHLFLIQTGWNPQVALDVDVENPSWAVKIGDGDAEIYRISSFKVRSGTWQRTISRGKPSHSPYQILQKLIIRTAPLRMMVGKGLIDFSNSVAAQRSPWLFCRHGKTNNSVNMLTDRSFGRLDRPLPNSFMGDVARKINDANRLSETGGVGQISEDVTTTDLRDIYIGSQFLQSGYNTVIAKLAAGHSNLSTTRRYLRARAWRRHSEGSVRELMDYLWNEVEEKKVCDPAILRGLCDNGIISEEQRERWSRGKDKTYLGMGCVDPFHPPRFIDPSNDGTERCRNQHRCTLCEHGIVFPESLSDLAKRLAEIQELESTMSAVSWQRASGIHEELAKLVKTLNQFDENAVAAQVDLWRSKIRLGDHQVLEWGGMYANKL